jgi:hypothetical protein
MLGSLAEDGNVSLLYCVQISSGPHPASYPLESGGRGVKLTTHLILLPRSGMHGAIAPSLICLHGVVLS